MAKKKKRRKKTFPQGRTPKPASELDCVGGLKALADPNRLRILDQILAAPANVSQIAKACGMTAYNASRHLAILHRAGLVDCTRQGQRRFYALSDACAVRIDRRRRTLDLGCCLFRLDTMLSP